MVMSSPEKPQHLYSAPSELTIKVVSRDPRFAPGVIRIMLFQSRAEKYCSCSGNNCYYQIFFNFHPL